MLFEGSDKREYSQIYKCIYSENATMGDGKITHKPYEYVRRQSQTRRDIAVTSHIIQPTQALRTGNS